MRFRIEYFLKEKSKAVERIVEMLKLVKNQHGSAVKMLQCDGGGEFQNITVKKLLSSYGVK